MDRKYYLAFKRPFERALRQLLLDFEFFVEDVAGLSVYSVEHRLKTYESASEKSVKMRLPIEELHDIAGVRVVVSTKNDVDVVARFFYRKEFSKDLQVIYDKVVERQETGYRARHIVVKLPGHYSRSVYETRVEVQLHTLAQHAFNHVSRMWVYKSGISYSPNWRQEFLDVSATLVKLDDRIAALHTEVMAASASGEDEPLTPFSFQLIVKEMFGEYEALENCVDAVSMLIDTGYNTNGLLRRYFSNPTVLRVRKIYEGMLHTAGRKTAEISLGMPMHHFYMMYGRNPEASERYARSLAASYENLPVPEDDPS